MEGLLSVYTGNLQRLCPRHVAKQPTRLKLKTKEEKKSLMEVLLRFELLQMDKCSDLLYILPYYQFYWQKHNYS